MGRGVEYSQKEQSMLVSLYQKGLNYNQLASTLGRPKVSVMCKIRQLGLATSHPQPEENEYILKHYKKKSAQEIADSLNITLGCLYTRYYRLRNQSSSISISSAMDNDS